MCRASAGVARVSLILQVASLDLLPGGFRFPAAKEKASPKVQVLVKPLFASRLQKSTDQSKSQTKPGFKHSD